MGPLEQLGQEITSPDRAPAAGHRVERIDPFPGLFRVDVVQLIDEVVRQGAGGLGGVVTVRRPGSWSPRIRSQTDPIR